MNCHRAHTINGMIPFTKRIYNKCMVSWLCGLVVAIFVKVLTNGIVPFTNVRS